MRRFSTSNFGGARHPFESGLLRQHHPLAHSYSSAASPYPSIYEPSRAKKQKQYYAELLKLAHDRNIELPERLNHSPAFQLALYLHRQERGQTVARILEQDFSLDHELRVQELIRTEAHVEDRIPQSAMKRATPSLEYRWEMILEAAVEQALKERGAPVRDGLPLTVQFTPPVPANLVNKLRLQESVLGLPFTETMVGYTVDYKVENVDFIQNALLEEAAVLRWTLQDAKHADVYQLKMRTYFKELKAMFIDKGWTLPSGYTENKSPAAILALAIHRTKRRECRKELQLSRKMLHKRSKQLRRREMLRISVERALAQRGECLQGGLLRKELRLVESVLGVPGQNRADPYLVEGSSLKPKQTCDWECPCRIAAAAAEEEAPPVTEQPPID